MMASNPEVMDSLNELSLMLFRRPLDELSEDEYEELKDFAGTLTENQMRQYGQQPDQKQIEGIVSNVLSNQEETKRISEQLMSSKILTFFKENAPLKKKKVGFDIFVKEAYGKA